MTWPTSTPPVWMRAASLGKLPDTCRVTRIAGEPVLDEDTLEAVAASDTIYEGPCRVRSRGGLESDQPVGELHETLAPYVATLPAQADADGVTAGDPNDVRVDDYLTVLESSDGDLQGRHFQVRHVAWSSWQIDRRLGLEDREQPQGTAAGS